MIQPHGVPLSESSLCVEATTAAPAATAAAVLTEDEVVVGVVGGDVVPVAPVVPVAGIVVAVAAGAVTVVGGVVAVVAGFVTVVGGVVSVTGAVVAGTVGVDVVVVGAVVAGVVGVSAVTVGVDTVGAGAVAVDVRVTEPAMSVLVTRVPLADDPPPHPARIPAETSASIDAPTTPRQARRGLDDVTGFSFASRSHDEANPPREPEPRRLTVIWASSPNQCDPRSRPGQ
jgi:hypothetical protein